MRVRHFAAFSALPLAACTVGDEDVAAPIAEPTGESTAVGEFETVQVTASRATANGPIRAVVTDLETGDELLTLLWDVDSGKLSWQLVGEELSRPIEDVRANAEPSLGQAIQIALEQWKSASGDRAYCQNYCAQECLTFVGIQVCDVVEYCSERQSCDGAGNCDPVERHCDTVLQCVWEWYPVIECCRWECWT